MSTPETESNRETLCGRSLGDYQIIRRVGGGATSDVFLARQISLGRLVALKILKDELSIDSTYVKRFLQEARSAARLEHPNVVRIYEVGELVDEPPRSHWLTFWKSRGVGAKTYRFIAQEYVDGMSLSTYLRRNGPTSILQTFAALEQIGSALARAADFQLVHRDVKPENLIIDTSGVIKVVDFGLARPIGPNDATWTESSLTKTGVAVGTPLYMSPEQARGQALDSRSDVYSLGVTAYRMLTGVAPFKGETPLAVVLKHLSEKPRAIRELRPDAPPELAALVEKMLEKKPSDRPESPAVMLKELAEAKKSYIRALASSDDPAATLELSLATSEFELAKNDESGGLGESSSTGGKKETRPLFLQTSQERAAFEKIVSTTETSLEWYTNRQKLAKVTREGAKSHSRGQVAARVGALACAFLLGGGVLLARNALTDHRPIEPPLEIQRFNTVEEQYVFALQSGSDDAWKSVMEYFPDQTYWKVRAERQLALVYVNEGDVDAAEEVFEDLAKSPERGSSRDFFPIAGQAWVAAKRESFDTATSLLSELSYEKNLDHMTAAVIGKTREIIQNHFGLTFNFMTDPSRSGGAPGRAPNRRGGRPGEKGEFGESPFERERNKPNTRGEISFPGGNPFGEAKTESNASPSFPQVGAPGGDRAFPGGNSFGGAKTEPNASPSFPNAFPFNKTDEKKEESQTPTESEDSQRSGK